MNPSQKTSETKYGSSLRRIGLETLPHRTIIDPKAHYYHLMVVGSSFWRQRKDWFSSRRIFVASPCQLHFAVIKHPCFPSRWKAIDVINSMPPPSW